jgi:hypothetical protein
VPGALLLELVGREPEECTHALSSVRVGEQASE